MISPNCGLVLLQPFVQCVSLYFAELSFYSQWTRLFVVFISFLSCFVTSMTLNVDSQMVAFLVGLLTSFAAFLFWIHDFRRFVTIQISGVKGNPQIQWQAFLPQSSFTRLLWVFDLFLDFRAVGWCYSATQGQPCDYHSFIAARQTRALQEQAISFVPTMLTTATRALSSLILIQICQVFIFPNVQIALLYNNNYVDLYTEMPAFRLVVFVSALVGLVDLTYTLSRLMSLGIASLGFRTWLVYVIHPSPWGSISLILDHGLRGLWGKVWHNYFQFTFRGLAKWVTASIKSRSLQQFLQLWFVFLVSAIMHIVGSFMLRGHSRPLSGQGLFFILQPVGILLQNILDDILAKSKRSSNWLRATNGIFCLSWLYLTLTLEADDLIRSGFWESRVLNGF